MLLSLDKGGRATPFVYQSHLSLCLWGRTESSACRAKLSEIGMANTVLRVTKLDVEDELWKKLMSASQEVIPYIDRSYKARSLTLSKFRLF